MAASDSAGERTGPLCHIWRLWCLATSSPPLGEPLGIARPLTSAYGNYGAARVPLRPRMSAYGDLGASANRPLPRMATLVYGRDPFRRVWQLRSKEACSQVAIRGGRGDDATPKLPYAGKSAVIQHQSCHTRQRGTLPCADPHGQSPSPELSPAVEGTGRNCLPAA